jgi:hypothetical protein
MEDYCLKLIEKINRKETDENPRKWVGETLEELVEEAKQAKIEKVNLHKSRPLQAFSFKERYGV